LIWNQVCSFSLDAIKSTEQRLRSFLERDLKKSSNPDSEIIKTHALGPKPNTYGRIPLFSSPSSEVYTKSDMDIRNRNRMSMRSLSPQ